MTIPKKDNTVHFPIRFERWCGLLSSALLLRPSDSYVEVGDRDVECRMGWAFRARFPRSAVANTTQLEQKPLRTRTVSEARPRRFSAPLDVCEPYGAPAEVLPPLPERFGFGRRAGSGLREPQGEGVALLARHGWAP